MMSFFVVERDATDGSMRVLVSHPAGDRSAALDALSAGIAAGAITVSGEVFVIDLGAATPVLLMPAPAVSPPAQTAWDAPAAAPGDTVLGDLAEALKRATVSLESEGIVAPESVDAEPATGSPDAQAGADGALDQLSEPVSVEELPSADDREPVPATAEDGPRDATPAAGEDAPPDVGLAPEDVMSDGQEGPAPAEAPLGTADLLIAEEVGQDAWPWANVDAFSGASAAEPLESHDAPPRPEDSFDTSIEVTTPTGDEAAVPGPDVAVDDVDAAIASLGGVSESVSFVAEPASVSAPLGVSEDPADAVTDDLRAAIDALDEPAVAESPLIVPSLIEGEDAYLPRPVILGDYDDEPVSIDEGDTPLSVEVIETGTDEGSVIEEPSAVRAITDAVSEAAPESPLGVDPFAAAYEPVRELDLGDYTCEDCIYINTCPKVGQSTPAECGSFQWKAD